MPAEPARAGRQVQSAWPSAIRSNGSVELLAIRKRLAKIVWRAGQEALGLGARGRWAQCFLVDVLRYYDNLARHARPTPDVPHRSTWPKGEATT